MSHQPLTQVLNAIIGGTNSVLTKRQFIGDFETFILNHIPYAQVRPRDLQTALIEFDGPQATGIDTQKPILVWHFGGFPYPVVKAAKLEYNYLRMWDGSGLNVHASILFGFQSNSPDHTLHTSPKIQLTPKLQVKRSDNDFGGQLSETIAAAMQALPTATVSGTDEFADLDGFLQNELDALQLSSPVAQREAPSDAQPIEIGGPRRGFTLNTGGGAPEPLTIELDGPAREYSSHRIFTYTGETLFNDQDKYNQMLWWYFGGKAQRITKGMRILLQNTDDSPSLFVGFTGPGGFP